ncbi:MAG TPA: ABC transporter permease, partial [Puia sp.]|nr:ABC transporter permease [Puia sp.]
QSRILPRIFLIFARTAPARPKCQNMPADYLKIAFRRLLRQRTISLINIFGLATGLAACLLIFFYVHYELGYDAYNAKASRIVRITTLVHTPESDIHIAGTPGPLGSTLARECPDVEAAVRIESATFNVRLAGETVAAKNFNYSEPAVFTIFSFKFLEGSATAALREPGSIVLTRSAATTYFGKGPALGKTLMGNGQPYRVTAVIADRPANSDLPIDALVYKDWSSATTWTDDVDATYTFVLFRETPDIQRFDTRLPGLTHRFIQPELDRAGLKGYTFDFEAEKLTDVHFSRDKLGDEAKGNRQFLTIFSWLAVFILLVALFNYVNLSTATAVERAKEIAIRKVAGAGPRRLVRQFLLESGFLIAIAWILSFGIVLAVLPVFNRLLRTNIAFYGWQPMLFLALLFPVTTFLAGGYPAFVLSRFSPLKALKGQMENAGKGIGLRKTFTVIQFIIALAMLCGTIVIYRQMQFIAHRDLGASRAGITCINIPPDPAARASAPAFFQALRGEAGTQGISIGSGIPSEGFQLASIVLWKGGEERRMMLNLFFADPMLLPMLDIKLAAGRNFSDSLKSDRQEGWIVNQALVRAMGWKTGIGESISYEGSGIKGKVIGVVKDFYFQSLHNVLAPMAMIYKTDPPLAVLVKATPKELPRLRQIWRTYELAFPFDYYFLDENFSKQYDDDRMMMTLFNAFTFLAVPISLTGIYGLVSLLVLRRTKEIGIRKVLGAPVGVLITLFTNDLLLLIGVAAAVAFPLAAMGASKWLASYAYHTGVSAWIFVLPAAIILLLTMGVTAFRIAGAAMANPVKALRSE